MDAVIWTGEVNVADACLCGVERSVLAGEDLHNLVAGTRGDGLAFRHLSAGCSEGGHGVVGVFWGVCGATAARLGLALVGLEDGRAALEEGGVVVGCKDGGAAPKLQGAAAGAAVLGWDVRGPALCGGRDKVPAREHSRALRVLGDEDGAAAGAQVVQGAGIVVGVVVEVGIVAGGPVLALLDGVELLGVEVGLLQGQLEVLGGEGLRVLAGAVRGGDWAGAGRACGCRVDGAGAATAGCGCGCGFLVLLGVAGVLCGIAGEADCGRLVEGRAGGSSAQIHTIEDVALVVAGLADVGRAVAVRDAGADAAVDPGVVVVVVVVGVVAVEAGAAAAVDAAAAAAATPEAALAARQAAAHGRVQALVAAAAPGLFPGKGLEVLLVFGVDGAAVLQGRHLLAGLVEVALGLVVVLFGALDFARNAALALLPGEDAAEAAAQCSRHGGWEEWAGVRRGRVLSFKTSKCVEMRKSTLQGVGCVRSNAAVSKESRVRCSAVSAVQCSQARSESRRGRAQQGLWAAAAAAAAVRLLAGRAGRPGPAY